MLRHLDLCSGIGGFHIAAGWAGMETIGFAEIDPYCCALLAQRWPGIRNYGDIRTADFSGLRGGVGVLSAGVPCQPSSLAGKRRGSGDERWLWEAVLDVVGVVQPTWVLLENPVGILSLDEFGGVLLRLGTFGYQVRAFSVPANSVGAKHRRQRVFLVANRARELFDRSGNAGARGRLESANGGEALADADGSERRPAQSGNNEHNGEDSGGEEAGDRSEGVCSSEGGREFRLTEPPLCGRADGIPNRSHRLKGLGNAVVPQQAYPFFSAIAATELGYGREDI